MWGKLVLTAGDGSDTFLSSHKLTKTFNFFGRSPEGARFEHHVLSKVSSDSNQCAPELINALNNGDIQYFNMNAPYISTTHFLIKRLENSKHVAVLVDLSTNGTYLDETIVGKSPESKPTVWQENNIMPDVPCHCGLRSGVYILTGSRMGIKFK